MLMYLLCMLAGIGIFLGIPQAIRATGIKRFYIEFHDDDDDKPPKNLNGDDEKRKKLDE
jgi:hypothetical protein